MKKSIFILVVLLFMVASNSVLAQQKAAVSIDTIASQVTRLSRSVQALEKIKFSGYIQAQFQIADTLGAKSFNGGDFAPASAQRFQVRRAYLKAAYNGELATYVLQINVNEKGFTIRDAYFSLKDPWLKAFSLTGGVFYRPFGYELAFSTSQRESPELARVTQSLFPNERDLGSSVTFQMPAKSKWHPIKIEAGLFAGNSIYAETDNKLDFIGRLGYADESKNKKISYGLGVSYYNGAVYDTNRLVYEMGDFGGVKAYKKVAGSGDDSSYHKREYIGLDGQFSINTVIGKTSVRADYMFGTQPGSSKKNTSPSDTTTITGPVYMRKFNGGVVYLIHTFPNSIHSVVLKYDFYDPNKDLNGDQVGQTATGAKATNNTDVAYTTWGFGYVAEVNKNLRFMAYYDLVKNEKSKNLKNYGVDLKDNIFTLRVQYKF
ncbi:MAG: hypothetical protein HXX13_12825 [Bacteroidetes bacterium]|nr:hypothetical protein [Bacteroidota bacterium]